MPRSRDDFKKEMFNTRAAHAVMGYRYVTTAELARRMGRDLQKMNKLINQSMVPLDFIEDVAKALDVDPSLLIVKTDRKKDADEIAKILEECGNS